MTTATEIDVRSIEHMDIEWQCETTFDGEPADDNRCDERATWLISKTCCGGTEMVCDECFYDEDFDENDWVECYCGQRLPDMRSMVLNAIRIAS